jgi:hypothetical protein
VRLLAAAPRLAPRALGAPRSPEERRDLDRRLEPARAALGVSDAASAWAEGQVLTLEDAVDYALVDGAERA